MGPDRIDKAELADLMVKLALKEGAEDASALCYIVKQKIVRFSNNSVTISADSDTVAISIYVGKDRKRIIGSSHNASPESVKRFVVRLVKSLRTLEPSDDYAPLPEGPFRYRLVNNFDPDVADNSVPFVDYLKGAIDAARAEGADRVSGILTSEAYEIHIATSASVRATDRGTAIMANVRAFSESDGSGHGLSVAGKIANFDPKSAGRTAGEYSKLSRKPRQIERGKYNVLLSPTVAADIFQHVGYAASAFSVLAGRSFLEGKLNQKIGHDSITIVDLGATKGSIGGRVFDDEGHPTSRTTLIDKGTLKSYLHNSVTAKKFKAKNTGNAGVISPEPWNLTIAPGSYSYDEILQNMRRGIVVTNNWYTRFQDPKAGAYSTLPRDASFYVEGGEIKYPIRGFRLSDTIPRQLSNVIALSKDRHLIKWWEVNLPVLCPYVLLSDCQITRAVG